jgi:MFS family permease
MDSVCEWLVSLPLPASPKLAEHIHRGMPNLFGVYQTFYVTELLPAQTASSIAWIGSIQLFLTTLMCLFGGILVDRGHLKDLIAAGTFFEVVGLLATSFSTEYWQLFLAQGICVGIGSGILGLLPVAVIAMYFEEKRMFATGIAATGASFGTWAYCFNTSADSVVAGVVVPITLRYLFLTIGFAWSVRGFALAILVTNVCPWAVLRLQSEGANNKTKFNLAHFKDPAFSAFCASFTLIMAATFAPFFYIQEYALNLGATDSMAFGLLAIMNAANLFGRFVPNTLADR